jgi:cytochrome c oxidase cbb3-type subunit 3
MSESAGYFVAIVVIANIAEALWLMWWTARGSGAKSPQETTHVWDGDLTEYNNPLPRWWLGLFILSILFGVVYLALFPGLGRFPGLLHWSSASQLQTEDTSARSAFESRYASTKGKTLAAIAQDPAALATGRNLFALNCSACHGSDARGAKGFPNLTDNDWLWGSGEDTVYQTIAAGRDGIMPAWGPVLGPQGVEQVEAYVLSLSGRHAVDASATAGKTQFDTLCTACHGADGRGNQALGAPNLTDEIWLHGGSEKDIRETITNGRMNHMPAHLERLGETKVRLVAAYVLSLSAPAHGAPENKP